MVFHFKAFDVLSADIDNKIHFGIEMQCRFEMRHRFNDPEIDFQRCLHHIFSVARYARAADGNPILR